MSDSFASPVGIAVVGAGRIGQHHATALRRHVPGAELLAVVDPAAGAAERLGAELGVPGSTDLDEVLADPRVEAVVITASSTVHAQLVRRAAAAGKAVFCEKPMAMTLAEADSAIAACEEAGVPLQVGFNRRFAADFAHAHDLVVGGEVGTPHLLRSTTRDPGLADPGSVPPWTIFTQTLIHDFDTLLWLNPGARAVEVHAYADALVAPAYKDKGLLDTAVVTIRFDNGSLATAEASFSAAYGYDVRGEVFGSGGMVTIGSPAQLSAAHWTAAGVSRPTSRADTDLLRDAYRAELAAFCEAVRSGERPPVGGEDARAALAVALAAITSVDQGRPCAVEGLAGAGR
jgi:myo-inositol 2-dehydrogenase/D-chiro-inositol 1-dehydrogenase